MKIIESKDYFFHPDKEDPCICKGLLL